MKRGGLLRRRKGLRRSGKALRRTPLRKRNRGRLARLRAVQFGPQAALCRISPCLVPGCAASPCDPHHVITRARGGTDADTVPLCRFHHTGGPESIHEMGRAWFERRHGVDVARALEEIRRRTSELSRPHGEKMGRRWGGRGDKSSPPPKLSPTAPPGSPQPTPSDLSNTSASSRSLPSTNTPDDYDIEKVRTRSSSYGPATKIALVLSAILVGEWSEEVLARALALRGWGRRPVPGSSSGDPADVVAEEAARSRVPVDSIRGPQKQFAVVAARRRIVRRLAAGPPLGPGWGVREIARFLDRDPASIGYLLRTDDPPGGSLR